MFLLAALGLLVYGGLSPALAVPPEGGECDIFIYSNLTGPPLQQRDTHDTCPVGNGARAYLLVSAATTSQRATQLTGGTNPRMREVAPDPTQMFYCLEDKTCSLIIKGYGLGFKDAVAIVPGLEAECPPSEEDEPVIIEASAISRISFSGEGHGAPDTFYAAFEFGEDAQTDTDTDYTICYAPALANNKAEADKLPLTAFHYPAGVATLGESNFECDFEEKPGPMDEQGDSSEALLPCGFRNRRERWDSHIVWQLGQGATETPDTGPEGDTTASLNGGGHYIYMDSPGFALGSPATVLTPPVSLSSGTYCVRFNYNMNGADVSALRIYATDLSLKKSPVEAALQDQSQEETTSTFGNWGRPRWVAVGNKGPNWHQGGFDLKTRGQQAMQIVFEAIAGRSELGDVAIDDVKILPGACPADIRHHIPKTLGQANQPLVCGEVRLRTGKHSADKSWYVDGAISCAGRGYSHDELNRTSWLPCCVPHFGSYKLVLEDAFGDGWTGSELEFRFFDRIFVFGKDTFQVEGFDKTYNLVIGALEIVRVDKPKGNNQLNLIVQLARPKSFVWCGVVEASKSGAPLRVDLTPALMRRYGVRSKKATDGANEQVTVTISDVLKANALFDVYCYSEVVGETLDPEREEKLDKEIAATRLRVSTDREPPHITDIKTVPSYKEIEINFKTDEASTIWCAAVTSETGGLFGSGSPLEGLLERPASDETVKADLARYFQAFGTELIVKTSDLNETQTLKLSGLVPDTKYDVYCFGEDSAAPLPNQMSPEEVQSTHLVAHTMAKVPTVKIARRLTVHRGFKLYVKGDAPGRVWCAAAPESYGIPSVADIIEVGAQANITTPGQEVAMELRGVEPNTPYNIFCVGASKSPDGRYGISESSVSSPDEVLENSVTAMSYGKYCEETESVETYTITDEKTPFHPISAREELSIRSYVLAQEELGLQGIYRINLLPNKTEIYDYYDNGGPFPKRYARVRVGRCVDNVGYYEQLRVGPLDGGPMTWERLAQPVETDCAGYTPQGVFGRRLAGEEDYAADLSRFFRKAFGYGFGDEECRDAVPTYNTLMNKDAPRRKLHPHLEGCLEMGPIFVQEVCEDAEDTEKCPVDGRRGRIWVGLRTPKGAQTPFYFIYTLPESIATEGIPAGQENVQDWVRRIIRSKELPEDFHAVWTASEFWVEGMVYRSLKDLVDGIKSGELDKFTPAQLELDQAAKSRRHLEETRAEKMRNDEARRRLEPMFWPGAAGTAGPEPTHRARRGGLEYRAVPEHIESQGRRFTVEAAADEEAFNISYAGWNMIVTNDRDTGLRIHHVTFLDKKVAFEIGLMEALAHYTVSERNFFFLDSWYGGLGAAARKVHKGLECPKTAVSLFWDGSLCVFEQDMARPTRSHWKAGDIRLGSPHTTLVLRQMITVSNYDYVTDYRFHLMGIFEANIAFTGELYAGIEVPWYSSRQADYGVQVTGAMRLAALHTHMAAWKIDFDIGEGDNWKRNSVFITEVVPDPKRHGANKMSKSFAETERDAAYFRNDTRTMIYEVVDETIRLYGTNYGGYRVIAMPGINPLHHDFELYMGPAAWAKYRTFTTVHKYGELDTTLPRDNKFAKRPAVSVDHYVADDEPIRNVDIVTWLSDGIFHIPAVEDMPMTLPIGNTLGWMVKPSNLFYEDPSMDLHNAQGGGVSDPGTCAVVRLDIGEVEPSLIQTWTRNYEEEDRARAVLA